MREIKTIVGLRAISVDEGAIVGTVSHVVVDLAEGRVLGLILGTGPGQRGVLAEDIKTIGIDAVMIRSREVARPLGELPALERRQLPPGRPLTAFTASGKRLGTVSAIFIDPYDMVVTRYEISGGPLKDMAEGVLMLPIVPGTIHGQDAIILPDEELRRYGRSTGGLRARLQRWAESAKHQAQRAAERAERVAETAGTAVKKELEIVRERAAELKEKTKETATPGLEEPRGSEEAGATSTATPNAPPAAEAAAEERPSPSSQTPSPTSPEAALSTPDENNSSTAES